MIIDLDNVGRTAKKIDIVLRAGEIDLEGEAVRLKGDIGLTGEIARANERIDLNGTIIADVSLGCTRCLEPVDRHLEIPFRDLFVERSGEGPDAEKLLDEDQLDESVVTDCRIDMTEVVREQILLALPEQVYCSDSCKGLCAKCGENLNLIDCNCADNEIDPRWAALKDLRDT